MKAWKAEESSGLVFWCQTKKIVVWLKNRNKLKETKEDTQHRLLNSLVKKRHASLVEGGNHQDMFITEKGKNRKHSEAFNTFSPIFFILYYRKCKMPAMWFPKRHSHLLLISSNSVYAISILCKKGNSSLSKGNFLKLLFC